FDAVQLDHAAIPSLDSGFAVSTGAASALSSGALVFCSWYSCSVFTCHIGRMEDLRQNSRAAVNPAGPAPMMTAVCCDTVMYPFRRVAFIYRKISSCVSCPRCVQAWKIEILWGRS